MMQKPLEQVAFVASNILSEPSADIIYIMEMCNAFSKSGLKTTLYVPRTNLDKNFLLEYYGVQYPFEIVEFTIPSVFIGSSFPGKSLFFSIVVSKTLSNLHNSMIFIRDPYLLFILSNIYKRKCLFEVHQFRFMRYQSAFYRKLVKFSLSDQVIFVCISGVLKKQWGNYGIRTNRIYVSHDAVNIDKFTVSYSKNEARKLIGLPSNRPMVVYTGSLAPGKGVGMLIRCANRLSHVMFAIVGGTHDEITRLQSYPSSENVLFIGKVEPKWVPVYQSAADVLALPNNKGSVIDDVTSPMKLFEYMASGRPIVATNIPSILEILEDGKNALISQIGDDLQMANNIESILRSPSLSDKLSSTARKALECHSWDSRVKYLISLWESNPTK